MACQLQNSFYKKNFDLKKDDKNWGFKTVKSKICQQYPARVNKAFLHMWSYFQ